ncbi:MAG: hypothetical protein OXE42_08695 [Gammaproteobacteria bacterium]|nr:hypothetical protein [Gammaproteobacteria bacterium]
MDNRLYFIVGDLVSNLGAGILIAISAVPLISTGWNMFIAMIVMMALGMVAGLFLSLVLSIFFGAMEVMVPVMLTGMFSGMISAMWLAMTAVPLMHLVWLGAITGLAVTCIIWLVNACLRGISLTEIN